jgi:hypothetical protein
MKPKRSCPGVPNRYSFSVGSSITEPKSMATVVVVLSGVSDRSSTPAATSVMAASVVSGGTSETEATAVVLPTPNPPAITIFTGMGAGAGSGSARGPASKSMSNLCLLEAAAEGECGVEPSAGEGARVTHGRRRWVWLVAH